MTVSELLTKEKPYSTEILPAVHAAILLIRESSLSSMWLIRSTSSATEFCVERSDTDAAAGDLTNYTEPTVDDNWRVNVCSQPSKGGSQWYSSTLLLTEVDLALEWDWKTTREEVQSLSSAAYSFKTCHYSFIQIIPLIRLWKATKTWTLGTR